MYCDMAKHPGRVHAHIVHCTAIMSDHLTFYSVTGLADRYNPHC